MLQYSSSPRKQPFQRAFVRPSARHLRQKKSDELYFAHHLHAGLCEMLHGARLYLGRKFQGPKRSDAFLVCGILVVGLTVSYHVAPLCAACAGGVTRAMVRLGFDECVPSLALPHFSRVIVWRIIALVHILKNAAVDLCLAALFF